MDARLTAFLAAGITLLALAVPALAGAATIGPQVERSSPSRYPTNLPGCRPLCRRGAVIPRGRVLLSRKITLEPGERRARVRFVCPARHRLMTFGGLMTGDVVPQIPSSELPYTNHRAATIIAERALAPLSQPSSGTLYAVCGRR
jgi:hypothetical protein